MKKYVPSDLDIQVNTLISEKFGVAEGSGVREICGEVYELLKTHISGSIRPDGTQILDPKLYQIWHLSKAESNVDVTPPHTCDFSRELGGIYLHSMSTYGII